MGGPVALEIGMMSVTHEHVVDEERWMSSERFNRVLAVYPEVLRRDQKRMNYDVYFGMLARGRLGGLLAGLGFMLLGLVLIAAFCRKFVLPV